MFDQDAIVETTNERTAIYSKWIIAVLPRLKLADAKSERIAKGVNKAEYASCMHSHCMATLSNVYSECSGFCLCTNWCTRTALVLVCVLFAVHTVGCELQMFDQEAIVETTNERTAIDSKRIITVLPRLKLADAK